MMSWIVGNSCGYSFLVHWKPLYLVDKEYREPRSGAWNHRLFRLYPGFSLTGKVNINLEDLDYRRRRLGSTSLACEEGKVILETSKFLDTNYDGLR